MRKNNKKLLLTFSSVILVLIVILFTLLHNSKGSSNIIEQSLQNTIVSAQKYLYQPVNYIKGLFVDKQQAQKILAENNNLKQQMTQQATLVQDNQRLMLENKKLKDALNYQSDNDQFEKLGVNIVANNPVSFHKEIMIDRGELDGLKIGMPVMNSQGIIGEITVLGHHTATVKLLTSGEEQYHISVMIIVNDAVYFGTIKQFDYKTQKFILTNVPLSATIPSGTVVMTSGLSEKYPRGLVIGKVDQIAINQYGLEKEGTVTPNEKYQELTPIYVIKYHKQDVVNEDD